MIFSSTNEFHTFVYHQLKFMKKKNSGHREPCSRIRSYRSSINIFMVSFFVKVSGDQMMTNLFPHNSTDLNFPWQIRIHCNLSRYYYLFFFLTWPMVLKQANWSILSIFKKKFPATLLGSTFHFDNHKLYSFLNYGLNMVIFHKISWYGCKFSRKIQRCKA